MHKLYKPKNCAKCGVLITPESGNQKYCGSPKKRGTCSWSINQRQKHAVRIEAAAERAKVLRSCDRCGVTFHPSSKRNRFCGSLVKQTGCSLLDRVRAKGIRAAKRKSITARLRFQVFHHFNFTCQYCGRRAPNVEIHIDHIVPFAKGGTDRRKNLTVACAQCNHGKSDLII